VHLLQYGSGWYIVGDRIGRYSAGQLVLVGSHLPHNWISDIDPGEHIADRDVVFQFHPQWVRDTQALVPELAALEPLLLRASRGIEFSGPAAERGAAELLAIGRSGGMARLQHITALLQTLADAPPAEYQLLASPGIAPPTDSEATRIVDLAMREVFINLNGTVSLTAIAARVGMSQSGFSPYFARDIAQASGYHNLSNFNRQFRIEHGVTPSEYRNRAGRYPTRRDLSGR
jgi:AraC-like DNA-binding protein